MEDKKPKPPVRLSGTDGNVFSILGLCGDALRRAGRYDEVKVFYEEAASGDYDHVLITAHKWFDVH